MKPALLNPQAAPPEGNVRQESRPAPEATLAALASSRAGGDRRNEQDFGELAKSLLLSDKETAEQLK